MKSLKTEGGRNAIIPSDGHKGTVETFLYGSNGLGIQGVK